MSEQRGGSASSDTIKSREPTCCPGQVGRSVGPLVRGLLANGSGPMGPTGGGAPFGVCVCVCVRVRQQKKKGPE